PVSSYSTPITIALVTVSGNGTLLGTTQVTPVGGNALFTGLRVHQTATPGMYRLSATSGTLSATSDPFTVTGISALCGLDGCTISDPAGTEPTSQNLTTATATIFSCDNTGVLSLSEPTGTFTFCNGACADGSVENVEWDCNPSGTLSVIYRIDKSQLHT